MYGFTGHLITQGFNTQLPKVSTSKSPTSNILLRNVDTRNYAKLRTVCDKRLYHPINTMNFEDKVSIDIFSAYLIRLCNNVSIIKQPNF